MSIPCTTRPSQRPASAQQLPLDLSAIVGQLSDLGRFGSARDGSISRDLDGEFDPGSGRTLAARLTHASRARTRASAQGKAANGCVTREQPAPKTGTSRGNLV